MKRAIVASILGITASVVSVVSSQAQGAVRFDNYAAFTQHQTQVTWGFNVNALGGHIGDPVDDPGLVIGLYAGPNNASWCALTLIATTPLFTCSYGGGWYDGGTVCIPSTLFTGTQTVTFQLRTLGGGTLLDGLGLAPVGQSALWTETPINIGGSIAEWGKPPDEMHNGPLALTVGLIPDLSLPR
jgi:hypothetical protein